MSKKNKIQEIKASIAIPKEDTTPLMVYGSDSSSDKRAKISEIRANTTSTRRNAASSIEKTNRPTLEQLEKDLEALGTMVKVGCKYGVSDNAVRKWIKRYKTTTKANIL